MTKIKIKNGHLISNLNAKVGDVVDGLKIVKVIGQRSFPIPQGKRIVMSNLLHVELEGATVNDDHNHNTEGDIPLNNVNDPMPDEPADWDAFFNS